MIDRTEPIIVMTCVLFGTAAFLTFCYYKVTAPELFRTAPIIRHSHPAPASVTVRGINNQTNYYMVRP